MTTSPDPSDDPAITGVSPETSDVVRPSATGLVAGPVEGETDVEIADVATGGGEQRNTVSLDQTLANAEGGIEGSTLDA